MNLISMKKQSEEEEAKEPQELNPSEYPWGLQITLCEEELEKLSIDKLPTVGATVYLTAKAKVTSVSSQSSMISDSTNVCLQITDLALEKPKKSAAELMYG